MHATTSGTAHSLVLTTMSIPRIAMNSSDATPMLSTRTCSHGAQRTLRLLALVRRCLRAQIAASGAERSERAAAFGNAHVQDALLRAGKAFPTSDVHEFCRFNKFSVVFGHAAVRRLDKEGL